MFDDSCRYISIKKISFLLAIPSLFSFWGYSKRFPFHIPLQTGDFILIWLQIRSLWYVIACSEGIASVSGFTYPSLIKNTFHSFLCYSRNACFNVFRTFSFYTVSYFIMMFYNFVNQMLTKYIISWYVFFINYCKMYIICYNILNKAVGRWVHFTRPGEIYYLAKNSRS